MVKSKRNLFSTMSSILKKGTVVTLCMVLIGLFLSVGCKKEKNGEETKDEGFCSYNKILMLIVDEQTNTFIGGKEMEFSQIADSFTITYEYVSPGDFGYLKLFYKEIDELLFHGTIFWMGTGEIIFPSDLLPPDQFDRVTTDDYVSPNGFENIFDPDQTYDYGTVWNAVQSLVKAREYLYSNPHQKVKFADILRHQECFLPLIDIGWCI